MQLYDLAGADAACRFSPHCWRARMALAHKGLEVATVPWRFTDKDAIAFSGQGAVPVLRDGATAIHDSWRIALHLDDTYPERPLMDGAQARAHTALIREWVGQTVHPPVMRVILLDLFARLTPEDQAYFRATREARFGKRLEELAAGAAGVPAVHQALGPARATLDAQAYLGGATPSYADYLLFGALQWARVASPVALLDDDDPVHAWRERCLDLFDGLARRTPAAA